jgi:CcmD family protein
VDHLDYLFAGFAVFWAGLFAYLIWLQARLRSVTRQLERLEERLAESEARQEAGRPATGAGQTAVREPSGERTTATS